ncbi:MAG: hypothetical protein RMK89_04190, partial [Armatimonadota bacterium]|nr:hypothetical protein [Armatimonadota bacterium]MDW8142646.1 hypothetical protein [Armatimonadota bacterium]
SGTYTVTLRLNTSNAIFRNVRLTRGNIIGLCTDTIVKGLTIDNLTGPVIQDAIGKIFVNDLQVNTYTRPTVMVDDAPLRDQRYVEIRRAIIGGTTYEGFYEKIYGYGYIKNRWDASPPDYSTYQFFLTNTTLAAPLILEFRALGDNPITVTGTITQLPSGDVVRVLIFRADKEPLIGDTPEFSQTFTSTGQINVNWTPSAYREYIIRVQAEMNQTSNPVVISNLEVAGGGVGQQAVEPAFVFVG